MVRLHRSARAPALCAAALVSALMAASTAPAQDAEAPDRESKIGTRVQNTRDADWAEMRRDEMERGRIDPQTGALLEAPPMIASIPREELEKARLPVLLPDDGRLIENMRLFAKRDYYVAVLRNEDYTVQITGTRIAQGPLETANAPERMRELSDAEGYIYQRTEYGCELSFMRYDVSYNISVECREPESDPHCTGKDYVLKLAKSLVYVGGQPDGNGGQ